MVISLRLLSEPQMTTRRGDTAQMVLLQLVLLGFPAAVSLTKKPPMYSCANESMGRANLGLNSLDLRGRGMNEMQACAVLGEICDVV